MIIKALNTFAGILDLSAMERLEETNQYEKHPFRAYIRPGQSIEVDDKCYTLRRVQDALNLGYIEIGNRPDVPTLSTSLVDPSYSGTTMSKIAGETLTAGEVVYYNDDGKVYKAKGDSETTMICMGIATTAAAANNNVVLLIEGLIRNSSVFSLTTGGQASKTNSAIVYVNVLTAGDITQTLPTTVTNIVQIIGYAVTTDTLYFKPDYTYIEI